MKTQTTIRNCDKTFRFVCPKNWEQLATIEDLSQRYCDRCERMVHLCKSDEETLAHARAGDCIARELPDESELPLMMLGMPEVEPEETASQRNALRWTGREAGIDDALANIQATRCCPQCDYPAPDWRKSCRVCGYEFGRVQTPK